MCQPILETHFLPRSSSEFTLYVFHNTSVLYTFLVNTHVFFSGLLLAPHSEKPLGLKLLVGWCLSVWSSHVFRVPAWVSSVLRLPLQI